jgi:hypothetical protein
MSSSPMPSTRRVGPELEHLAVWATAPTHQFLTKEATMSTRKFRRLLLAPLLVVASLAWAPGASAAPLEASGTLTYTSSTIHSVRTVGGTTIIELSANVTYTGSLTGTSTLHGRLIFHPNGRANFHDVETFTGTVNGVPGTVTFNLKGSSDPELVVKASATVVDATGELAGLHGVLFESAVVLDTAVGPVGTYTGKLSHN